MERAIKATWFFRILAQRVLRPVVMALHDLVLNRRGKALRRTLDISPAEGAELRRHGFQPANSDRVTDVAHQIRAQISDEVIATTRQRMGDQPDGALMDARRGVVHLELSPETTEDVLRLAFSDEILRPVIAYLGVVPKLNHVGVTLTIPHGDPPEATGAELWHRDSAGLRSATLFVYLSDVDEGSGPLHVISTEILTPSTRLPIGPDRHESEAKKNFWLRARFQDEEIVKFAPTSAVNIITGPAGTGLLLDQHSAYHKGGYSTETERLALQIHYATEAKPNSTDVTSLFDSLPENLKGEFLADDRLRFMLTPSTSAFQRRRVPQKLYLAALRLSAQPRQQRTASGALD